MSNEINTVQGLWNKFGSGYWHNRNPAEAITYNEVPLDIFAISGSYGGTECFRLDDISKKEIREWRYTFRQSPLNISFLNTGGTKTIQVDSWKQEYVNGSPVGSVVGIPFTIDSSLSSYPTAFSPSINLSNNTLNISCSENVNSSARSGFIFLRQGDTNTLSDVLMMSQPAATFSTREDLYVRDSLNRWQWDYNQAGQAFVKNFDVVSEHVELRNGKVISTSKRDFNYTTQGGYTGYFYTGKDGTIVRCWPYSNNTTSQIRYLDIVLYRDGASSYRIMCQQNKQY